MMEVKVGDIVQIKGLNRIRGPLFGSAEFIGCLGKRMYVESVSGEDYEIRVDSKRTFWCDKRMIERVICSGEDDEYEMYLYDFLYRQEDIDEETEKLLEGLHEVIMEKHPEWDHPCFNRQKLYSVGDIVRIKSLDQLDRDRVSIIYKGKAYAGREMSIEKKSCLGYCMCEMPGYIWTDNIIDCKVGHISDISAYKAERKKCKREGIGYQLQRIIERLQCLKKDLNE